MLQTLTQSKSAAYPPPQAPGFSIEMPAASIQEYAFKPEATD